MYDIVIIGAGPAGLTAALYALRADKKVMVLEKETFGGQITYSPKVENYPGIMQMSGNEFAETLIDQVMEHGGEIELDRALKIEKKDGRRVVVTENGKYETKAVIIASGSKHRRLGLEKEDEFTGSGVSYCAVCDGAFYKEKDVALIGGGNTALQEAILLSDYCKSVTLVQNLPYLTGEALLRQSLEGKKNVNILLGKTVSALLGDGKLEGIEINDEKTGEKQKLTVDGVFVAIGQEPENEPFKDTVRLNERGYIESDENCTTSDKAIFVAGDCRTKAVRQITTAVADGACAALAACRYVDSLN